MIEVNFAIIQNVMCLFEIYKILIIVRYASVITTYL